MSYDHKPTNKGWFSSAVVAKLSLTYDKEETDRITAAGGFVEFGRVNGKHFE